MLILHGILKRLVFYIPELLARGLYTLYMTKELGFFDIIFAQTLTIHNICLTHFTPSILIYANALGYILSIKVEFVMRNII